MPVYPEKLSDLIAKVVSNDDDFAGSTGRAASFECGCTVEICISIDAGKVAGGGVRSNGCGYMVASAAVMIDLLHGAELRELHGLEDSDLLNRVEARLGSLAGRRRCAEVCIASLHRAFESHRAMTLSEYSGEVALICTCFGVSEEAIAVSGLTTVEDVSSQLMAGRGCGSCRGLIEEIIDGTSSASV
ncbi:MAG TPA: (2Fe-2S)-binding protein [Pyrinomonadaceae bacterium]|nr:(2Fe-2S)-binding protein [Pyrinomonadaceae bacterium]